MCARPSVCHLPVLPLLSREFSEHGENYLFFWRCNAANVSGSFLNRYIQRVKIKERQRIFRYAPVILWAGVVLFLATSAGAASETSRFIGPLINLIYPQADPATRAMIHATVRKCAHFTEYAVFAVIVSRALLTSSRSYLKSNWHVGAVLCVAVLATIDETSQAFNSNRTGSIYDIMIDVFGGVAAVTLVAFLKDRWPLDRMFQISNNQTTHTEKTTIHS